MDYVVSVLRCTCITINNAQIDYMLTIDNIDKISNCIGYDTYIKVADTHYSFLVCVDNKMIEITLSRHKPKFQNSKPHPHKQEYLLQCNHHIWKHYWLHPKELKDIWTVSTHIEQFINEVK